MTPNEQLLSMLDPQQARLLDQQMRNQQIQQQSQGAGMLSGLVQAGLMGANTIQGAFGKTPVGANEAISNQIRQGRDVVSEAVTSAEGATSAERLKNIIARLKQSNNPLAIQKATELSLQLPAMEQTDRELSIREDKERRLLAKEQAVKEPSVKSDSTLFDEEGNIYQRLTMSNGDIEVKPISEGAPDEPRGKLLTPSQVSNSQIADRQINLNNSKQHLELQQEARQTYQAAKSSFSSASKVFDLISKAKDETGGLGDVGRTTLKKYLGIADDKQVTVQELDKALKQDVLQNLKATFGGSQITDAERAYLERTLPSIMDSPELIKRKAEANMSLQQKIMDRSLRLYKTTDYVDYVSTETSLFDKDYFDTLDRLQSITEEEQEATTTPESSLGEGTTFKTKSGTFIVY